MLNNHIEEVKTLEYIEWLVRFIDNKGGFTDDLWLYKKEEISEQDHYNVNLLQSFFGFIDKYCLRNLIEFQQNEGNLYYTINIKGNSYQVGLVVGQGAYNYINKVSFNSNRININQILADIPPLDIQNKMEKLKKLKVVLKECKKAGVPRESIRKAVHENL